jgi:hypothetical protein
LDGSLRHSVIKDAGLRPRKTEIEILRAVGAPADTMLRCRYELKYQITEAKAAAVENFIQPYIHLDRYCNLQPTKDYPIVSLYLDSPDFKLCQESLIGKKNRFKLRIRSYTDDPNYPRFLEIKRRMNAIVIKDRHRVMQRDIAPLLSGLSLPPQYYSTEQEALKQFLLYMTSINAKPVVRVRYIRRAYEGDSENMIRITFDRQLAYKVTNEPDISLNSSGWYRYMSNDVILEIKFTSRFPAWLSRMVQCLDLQQESFSKYVSSVKGSASLGFFPPELLVR